MGDLLDRCLAKHHRNFPDGYGFAIAYLSDDLNPCHLRDGAFKVVEDAFAGRLERAADWRKDDDLIAFVNWYADADCFEEWAIEAAQLVLQAALAGHENSRNVMRLCGHSGY